jgi:hypothetical protein
VFLVVEVGFWFVDDYLMTVIEVEVMVAGGQVLGEDPAAFALIDELVIGDIVVGLDVGDVVILYMVIPRGTPGGLNADVDGKFDLCLRGSGEGEADQDGACQKVLFHTF